MGEFFQKIIDWFNNLDDMFMEFGQWILDKLYILFIEILNFLLEAITEVAVSILQGFSYIDNFTQSLGVLPPEIHWGLNLLNITSAITVLIGARITRFVLNMIPFI